MFSFLKRRSDKDGALIRRPAAQSLITGYPANGPSAPFGLVRGAQPMQDVIVPTPSVPQRDEISSAVAISWAEIADLASHNPGQPLTIKDKRITGPGERCEYPDVTLLDCEIDAATLLLCRFKRLTLRRCRVESPPTKDEGAARPATLEFRGCAIGNFYMERCFAGEISFAPRSIPEDERDPETLAYLERLFAPFGEEGWMQPPLVEGDGKTHCLTAIGACRVSNSVISERIAWMSVVCVDCRVERTTMREAATHLFRDTEQQSGRAVYFPSVFKTLVFDRVLAELATFFPFNAEQFSIGRDEDASGAEAVNAIRTVNFNYWQGRVIEVQEAKFISLVTRRFSIDRARIKSLTFSRYSDEIGAFSGDGRQRLGQSFERSRESAQEAPETKELTKRIRAAFEEDKNSGGRTADCLQIKDVRVGALLIARSTLRSPHLSNFRADVTSIFTSSLADASFLNCHFTKGSKSSTMNDVAFVGSVFRIVTFGKTDFSYEPETAGEQSEDPVDDRGAIAPDFANCRFYDTDFGLSDLSGADFSAAQFGGGDNDLTHATLREANFAGATGLGFIDFSGSDLKGARLPSTIDIENVGVTIEQVSKHGQRMFLMLMVLLLVASLVCLNIASEFFDTGEAVGGANGTVNPLPWLDIAVAPVDFFRWLPLPIVLTYLYFHLFVARLWTDIGLLPTVMPDGRPVDKAIYPWVIASLSRRHARTSNSGSGMLEFLEPFVATVAGYFAIPALLIVMAVTAMATGQNALTIAIALIYSGLASIVSYLFYREAGSIFDRSWNARAAER